MIPQEAGKLLWESAQQGLYYPYALQGRLNLEQAYQVQLEVLARHLSGGETQAGWKIGLTADAVRAHFRSQTAVFGYLLASNGVGSGHSFDSDQVIAPSIEAELCFTLAKDLHGPGVTPEAVLEAVAAVSPAFEIIERRGDMAADLPLGVADDVSQWAYVLGSPLLPYPRKLDLGGVRMELRRNGEVVAGGLGREAIDNQIHSLAWLANQLAAHGKWIEAGQIVLSGSFNRPLPINKGDRWEASFSGIGKVACEFA
jgi:2-keto-4-pentenoate hydratase